MTHSLPETVKIFDVISLKIEKPILYNFICLLVLSIPLLVPNFKSIR